MAFPLHGIRSRCGGTSRGGSGRTSHLRPLPPPAFLTPGSGDVDASHSRLLDYQLVRRRDPPDVLVPKAMSGAECSIEHYIVIFNTRLQLRLQGKSIAGRLNIVVPDTTERQMKVTNGQFEENCTY
ncbi:unnamed protein product [Schistocephalus solidus]|uniref:Riboflavin kinase n=1 Tax=Schistocephalus solidus TaxID=70667 RepID=A0A183TAW1_SCHSO|nr:unnamed protein product [Schistocephalus solidus]